MRATTPTSVSVATITCVVLGVEVVMPLVPSHWHVPERLPGITALLACNSERAPTEAHISRASANDSDVSGFHTAPVAATARVDYRQ